MPRIDILEQDLTRATNTVGTDIPYIPGFAYKQYDDEDNLITPDTPQLCTSILQFEHYFGTEPVKFVTGSSTSAYMIDNNSLDRSYIMARELLALGMPIYYHAIQTSEASGLSFDETKIHDKLIQNLSAKNIYEPGLRDKGEYTIKYITSGGYANYGITHSDPESNFPDSLSDIMLEIAKTRGDAVALIEDTPSQTTLDPKNVESFYNKLNADTLDENNAGFGSAFIGWGRYKLTKAYKVGDTKISEAILPACFGYLATLALNIKVSPNWLAMAGTTRGLIPNLIELVTPINNAVANAYQPTKAESVTGSRALNAITNIKPYGLCVWGNRTLKKITEEHPLAGTAFLNTRNMISDIKKVAYRVAKSLIYEQNNETLWLNFKSQVAPFLDQLKSGAGIADYKLLKLDTHYNGSSLGKEEFACAIRIIPVYAVETFEITVVVSDADVAVE